MDRERLDRWCAQGILGLMLAILTWGPLATGGTHPLQFLVIQGLTVGVVLLWLARLWLGRAHRWLWPPVGWAVVAFVGYALMRYSQADIEYVARQEWIRVLVYALVFFAVLNHLHHKDSTQIVVLVLVFLAMAISLYAVYQYVTNSRYVWYFVKPEQYLKRGSGTYICPNHLAGFLEMVLPLALSYLFLGRLGAVTKVLLGYAALVIMAGIGVSISRGGWVATGLGLVVLFSVLIRYRDYRLPALVFLVILVSGGVLFMRQARHSQRRFQELFTAGKLEDVRFRLWRPALRLWQEHRWVGAGPGHFDYRFAQYRPEEVQMRAGRVHNDYLNTLTDWGLIGAGLVAGAWVLVYQGAFRTWRFVRRAANDLSVRQSNKSALVLGAGVGLLGILLHSAVDFNMHIPANALLAVTLMALLSSHWRFATDRYWVSASGFKRILATLVGMVGVVYLAQQGIRRAQEYAWLERAKREPDYSSARLAALLKANAVEPKNFDTAYQIGEVARLHSWQGGENYQRLAQLAMPWFQQAMRLNPYDGYSWLRYGMCLDWLGRREEAGRYFERANQLDPNGYYMVAHQGWHRIQLGDYAAAKPWFERSLRLKPEDNPIALSYLGIINRRLAEGAGGR